MEFTTQFELHSQTTRLVEGAPRGSAGRRVRGSHPLRRPVPRNLDGQPRRGFLSRLQLGHENHTGFQI